MYLTALSLSLKATCTYSWERPAMGSVMLIKWPRGQIVASISFSSHYVRDFFSKHPPLFLDLDIVYSTVTSSWRHLYLRLYRDQAGAVAIHISGPFKRWSRQKLPSRKKRKKLICHFFSIQQKKFGWSEWEWKSSQSLQELEIKLFSAKAKIWAKGMILK